MALPPMQLAVDLLPETVEMDALFTLHRSAVVETVHEKALAAAHAAPEIKAANHALAREQTNQRAFESLEPDQVLVEPLEMFNCSLLRSVERKSVGNGVLPHPFAEIRACAAELIMAVATVVRVVIPGAH